MAYNPYYPYYPQFQQVQPQQQQSALIHVQSEQQAREWSVSPGCSLMFIDDNAPYIYTKTAGNSQLEPCVFKIFQVSEIGGQNAPKTAAEDKGISIPDYVTRSEYDAITAQIDDIRKQIKELTENESAEQQ
jgi:hypothetical protein